MSETILGRGTALKPVEIMVSGCPQKRAVKAKSMKQEPVLGVSPSGIPVIKGWEDVKFRAYRFGSEINVYTRRGILLE